MTAFKLSNTIFLGALLLGGAWGFRFTSATASLIFWLFAAMVAVVVVGIFLGSRLCARVSLLPALAVFIPVACYFVLNLGAFLLGHPRYQDSPATILVVQFLAALLLFPSGLAVWSHWANRQTVWRRAP